MKKTIYHSPLGAMTILADDNAIFGLWFNDQKYYGGQYQLNSIEDSMTLQAKKATTWLNQYFARQNPSLAGLKLTPQATPFQKQVYQALLKVPYGQTATYQDLSTIIQKGQPQKQLARAIGNAIAHNQLLLLIPCHRIIGSDGSLTGYAGGLKRKQALLELEGSLA